MRLRKINLIVWSTCWSVDWFVDDWKELLFCWDPICFQSFTSWSRSNKESLPPKSRCFRILSCFNLLSKICENVSVKMATVVTCTSRSATTIALDGALKDSISTTFAQSFKKFAFISPFINTHNHDFKCFQDVLNVARYSAVTCFNIIALLRWNFNPLCLLISL